jgi:hypothetical protein
MAAHAEGIAIGSIGNPEEGDEDDSEVEGGSGQEDSSGKEKRHAGQKGCGFHRTVNPD